MEGQHDNQQQAPPQPLPAILVPFDQPVKTILSVYEPFIALSLTGWIQQFDNYCMSNMIPMEPVDQQNQILPANNQRRAVFLGTYRRYRN